MEKSKRNPTRNDSKSTPAGTFVERLPDKNNNTSRQISKKIVRVTADNKKYSAWVEIYRDHLADLTKRVFIMGVMIVKTPATVKIRL